MTWSSLGKLYLRRILSGTPVGILWRQLNNTILVDGFIFNIGVHDET
jgi:hypothetical protein